jgi:hypothetical protein
MIMDIGQEIRRPSIPRTSKTVRYRISLLQRRTNCPTQTRRSQQRDVLESSYPSKADTATVVELNGNNENMLSASE